MINFDIPVMGFAAYSGTGKTTLLSQIIPLLKQKGYRIGVIKKTHHRLEIDKPGKDSHTLREAGAEQIVVAAQNRTAIIIEKSEATEPPTLDETLANLQCQNLDLVLVEGFKKSAFTKIELHRKDLGKPYLHPEDKNIIAIACDCPLDTPKNNISVLDINNTAQVVDFIVNNILQIDENYSDDYQS